MRSAAQCGEVRQRAVLGLAGFAVAFAQQDRRWRAPIGDDSDIHVPTELGRFVSRQAKPRPYMTALHGEPVTFQRPKL